MFKSKICHSFSNYKTSFEIFDLKILSKLIVEELPVKVELDVKSDHCRLGRKLDVQNTSSRKVGLSLFYLFPSLRIQKVAHVFANI